MRMLRGVCSRSAFEFAHWSLVLDAVRIGRPRMFSPLFMSGPVCFPSCQPTALRFACAHSTDSRSVTVAMELFQRFYQPAKLMTESISTMWRSE